MSLQALFYTLPDHARHRYNFGSLIFAWVAQTVKGTFSLSLFEHTGRCFAREAIHQLVPIAYFVCSFELWYGSIDKRSWATFALNIIPRSLPLSPYFGNTIGPGVRTSKRGVSFSFQNIYLFKHPQDKGVATEGEVWELQKQWGNGFPEFSVISDGDDVFWKVIPVHDGCSYSSVEIVFRTTNGSCNLAGVI